MDDLGEHTRKIFETEKALGMKATYYFRFSTVDRELIREMTDTGFDVGLHFETIADYAREHNIENKNEIDMELMKRQLKRTFCVLKKLQAIRLFLLPPWGA